MNGGKQLEAEFVQYRAMRQEIAALRRQRAALYVTDTVRASASEHPYLAHTVAIAGKDQRLTRRIDARIERLRRQCETVENAIVAEEDSRDRLVLSLRYLEGSSWREIGQRMGTGEDAARKRAERFFVRSQKSEGKNTGSSKYFFGMSVFSANSGFDGLSFRLSEVGEGGASIGRLHSTGSSF